MQKKNYEKLKFDELIENGNYKIQIASQHIDELVSEL